MLLLTEKELKSHQNATQCHICRKTFTQKLVKNKNHQNVRGHFTAKCKHAAQPISNLRCNVPNKISVVSHNGSNYDYHFITKELANELKGKFECLRENTEDYKIFSVPIEKEIKKSDKDGNKDIATVSYKIKFVVDSARFMACSLSNLVDNLLEGIHKIKSKDCNYFLGYTSVNYNLMKYKCLSCNKNYSNKIDEKLKKQFKNTFKFLITILINLFCY